MSQANNKNFQPAGDHLCPICQGQVQWSYCPSCKANTILNWWLPGLPSDPELTKV